MANWAFLLILVFGGIALIALLNWLGGSKYLFGNKLRESWRIVRSKRK